MSQAKRSSTTTRPRPFAAAASAGETPLPPLVVEVMEDIQNHWSHMQTENFNPVPHSLALIDSTSLGRDYKSFKNISDRLEKAMDLIVNEYHQGFQESIVKFSGVVENISDSKQRVLKMQNDLENCKEWLQNKRCEFIFQFR